MQPAPAIQLALKPDYAQTQRRFDAWWDGQVADRPPVVLGVDDGRPRQWPAAKTYASERERWFDIEYRLEQFAAGLGDAPQLADNLPMFFPNLGPELCATVYGADLEFTKETSWSKPIAGDCRAVLGLNPDLDTPYWQTIRRATDLSLAMGRGRWLTGITDLHTNGDLLAALRDPQHLLEEMADDPEAVQAAMEHLTPHFRPMYDDLAGRIRAAGLPTLSWIPAPLAGRMTVVQCDLICMISPRAFKRHMLPALTFEMRATDRSIFHLDGPGALPHLDALCACPDLDAIQWVSGSGHGPGSSWLHVYQKIQAAGKAMQIICDGIPDALALMEGLRPEGCFFSISGRYRPDEVQRFLDKLVEWTARKRST